MAIIPAAMLVGMIFGVARGHWRGFGAVAVFAIVAAPLIHRALWPAAQLQAFGLGNLSHFDETIKTQCESGRKLTLAGDARAFLYVMPMTNLRYRTVFDVDQRPGQNLIEAWLGPDAAAIRGEYQIVVDQGELSRFSRTYRHIQPMP